MLPDYADAAALGFAVNELYTLQRVDVGIWVNRDGPPSAQHKFSALVLDTVKRTVGYESRVQKNEPVRKEYKSIKSVLMGFLHSDAGKKSKVSDTGARFGFLSRQAPEVYVFGAADPAEWVHEMRNRVSVDSLIHACLVFSKACSDVLATAPA